MLLTAEKFTFSPASVGLFSLSVPGRGSNNPVEVSSMSQGKSKCNLGADAINIARIALFYGFVGVPFQFYWVLFYVFCFHTNFPLVGQKVILVPIPVDVDWSDGLSTWRLDIGR